MVEVPALLYIDDIGTCAVSTKKSASIACINTSRCRTMEALVSTSGVAGIHRG
jgi:hypothetical protein